MLKLYYAPGACSLASHIVLEELGEPYETVLVDLTQNAQHTPEYLRINPNARVPALATPLGVLTENPAILSYLADIKPSRELIPAGPYQRARAISIMSWLASTVHIAFAHVFRPSRYHADEAAAAGMRAKAEETIKTSLAQIDAELNGLDWAFGRFSVVDPYLLVFRRCGSRVGLDMSAYPHLVAHAGRVAARQATQTVLAREGIRIDG
jgi:glutathione S-transferase